MISKIDTHLTCVCVVAKYDAPAGKIKMDQHRNTTSAGLAGDQSR